MRYSFSGHETFHCRSLWLKKGVDYLEKGNTLLNDSAIVDLGVGKNMVSSIRYWLKVTTLVKDNELTALGKFLFGENGRDSYCDDIATLWLLHYHLTISGIASLYRLTFVDFQRERKEFDRETLQSFVKRMCNVPEQKNVYNDNTVRKDIGVLLQNYVVPLDLKLIERFSALFIDLNLIISVGDNRYRFSEIQKNAIPDEVILYSLLTFRGSDLTLSFDKIQVLSLIFCIPTATFLERLAELAEKYPDLIDFTDISGIRNILFKNIVNPFELLTSYYCKQ